MVRPWYLYYVRWASRLLAPWMLVAAHSVQAGVVATAQQAGVGWDPERGALSTTRSAGTR